MILLIAVIIGYLLGIAPFVIPKIYELFINKEQKTTDIQDSKEQETILDEWLNGKTDEPVQKNQQDIYYEYITGKVKGE